MGGVSSFNYNIINYSSLINSFNSKVILIKAKEDNRLPFLDNFLVDEVILFEYSEKENGYYVQKRLNQLLGNEPGALVTDNALTLNAADRFNNPKTIFHLLHDFFYVNQNIAFGNKIDVAIAHSTFFSDAVFASNPSDFAFRSFYIPYGVKQIEKFPLKRKNQPLNLMFLGRLDVGKGANNLIEIENQLFKKSIKVNWTIIGKGPFEQFIKDQWKNKKNVIFCQPETTQEVYQLLSEQDVFVFPTSFEGTPVSIKEALSNGLVTIVSDLPGGIRDMITEDVGFRVKLNYVKSFVDCIEVLNNDRKLLNRMQFSAFEKANKQYDISKNADKYFELFLKYKEFKREQILGDKIKIGSLLDNHLIPNKLVKLIRSLK
jgi:glycosyltransferase involved in cell wall biosynthesis